MNYHLQSISSVTMNIYLAGVRNRSLVQNNLRAAYGTDNIFNESMTETEYKVIFRIPTTTFYFQLRLQDNLFELKIGSGYDAATTSLLNAVTMNTAPWVRGINTSYAPSFEELMVFTAKGFFLSLRTTSYRFSSSSADVASTKTVGVQLLYRPDGTLHPTQLDCWAGTFCGANFTGGNETLRGQWIQVRRYDQQTLTLSSDAIETRMPYIGFQSFPDGFDAVNSRLYGVKLYSPFGPGYFESALFRTFPGDVYRAGETVTDERGANWYLSDDGNPMWYHLLEAFPYQFGFNTTRTGLAW